MRLARLALLLALAPFIAAPRSAFSPGSVPAAAIGGGTANCMPYFNASGVLVCTNSPTYTPAAGLAVPDPGDGLRGINITANSATCPEPTSGINLCAVGSTGSELLQTKINSGSLVTIPTIATGFAAETAMKHLTGTGLYNAGATVFPSDLTSFCDASDNTKVMAYKLSGMTTGKTMTLAGVGAVDSTITLPPVTSYALATTRATHLGIAVWGDGDDSTADTGDMVCAAIPNAGACVTVCPETAGVPTCGTACNAAQAVRFLAYCK